MMRSAEKKSLMTIGKKARHEAAVLLYTILAEPGLIAPSETGMLLYINTYRQWIWWWRALGIVRFGKWRNICCSDNDTRFCGYGKMNWPCKEKLEWSFVLISYRTCKCCECKICDSQRWSHICYCMCRNDYVYCIHGCSAKVEYCDLSVITALMKKPATMRKPMQIYKTER